MTFFSNHIHRFEGKKARLLPLRLYWQRQMMFIAYGFALISFSLLIGIIGYMRLANLCLVDAFYNSSMILSGMGPTFEMPDDRSKIFAACYSLYSGVAFLSTTGVIFAPLVHRVLHSLHVEDTEITG